MRLLSPEQINAKLKTIKTFAFDVDGVFTDGTMMLMPNGELLRSMSTRDGYALQYAIKKGYKVVIITGGASEWVQKRFEHLGVKDIFGSVRDKLSVFKDYAMDYQLNREETLFMGDDLPDYAVMKHVGLAVCPKNAATEILDIAHYISPFEGGKGCVREIIEKTLRAQNNWHIDEQIKSI
jgi:3-deoxy-D-manno-octulosonate 8-phosphate phosphatase (KDO 8-P phosphatase)